MHGEPAVRDGSFNRRTVVAQSRLRNDGYPRTADVVGHRYRHGHVRRAGGEAMRTHADFITAVAIVALIMLTITKLFLF